MIVRYRIVDRTYMCSVQSVIQLVRLSFESGCHFSSASLKDPEGLARKVHTHHKEIFDTTISLAHDLLRLVAADMRGALFAGQWFVSGHRNRQRFLKNRSFFIFSTFHQQVESERFPPVQSNAKDKSDSQTHLRVMSPKLQHSAIVIIVKSYTCHGEQYNK